MRLSTSEDHASRPLGPALPLTNCMALVSWLASLDLIILTFKVQTIGKHLVGWFLRGQSKLKHVKCSELCLENSECSINVVIGTTFVNHQNNVYHHYHHCTGTSSSILSVNQNLFLRLQPCTQHYPSFPGFEPRLIYQSAGTTDLCVTVMGTGRVFLSRPETF